MRIEVPREFDRLGAVRIYGLQKIYELDAGAEAEISGQNDAVGRSLPAEAHCGVLRKMAIVVPVKSERLQLAPVLTYPSMEHLDLGNFAAVVQALVDRRVGAPAPVALLVP